MQPARISQFFAKYNETKVAAHRPTPHASICTQHVINRYTKNRLFLISILMARTAKYIKY